MHDPLPSIPVQHRAGGGSGDQAVVAASPAVLDAVRAAGFSGEVLCGAAAAQRAGLSTRALLARHRRSVAAGRPAPAAFPDDRLRSDGKPKVLWFPVEDLDAISAERALVTTGPVDLTVAQRGDSAVEDPLGRSGVVHAFELEVERLRGELAAVRVERDAAVVAVRAATDEVARLRAAVAALTAPAQPA